MNRFLIIADDFTGANDTGVQLKKRGINTDVIFHSKSIDNNERSYVIDTESRGLSEEEAFLDVEGKVKNAFKQRFDYVYKKIDSTLRGNIVSEIKAVDKYYNAELIIFAPAYPDNKRITTNEIHKINGMPISETEISKDPKKPVKVDNIKLILKNGFDEGVTHVCLEELRNVKTDFSKGRIYTFDAETNEDLMIISNQITALNKKVLWVGSAGLADSILKVNMRVDPSIAVVGSISEVSKNQLHYAVSRGTNLINVDIGKLLKNRDIQDIVNEALEKINKGTDVIIASSYEREDYERAIEVGKTLGCTKEEVSVFTQKILGEIVDNIVENTSISGMFLTGGDTAIGVIEELCAKGSNIKQEVMTGIPLMTLNGGKCHGLKVITKAGAFGEVNAIEYCLKKLKEDI